MQGWCARLEVVAQLLDAIAVQVCIVTKEVALFIKPNHGDGGAEDEFVVEGQRIEARSENQVHLAVELHGAFEAMRIELDDFSKTSWVRNDQCVQVSRRQMEAGRPFAAVPHGVKRMVVLVNLETEALSELCAFQRGGHRQDPCGIGFALTEQLLCPVGTAGHPDHALSPSGEHPCIE